MTFWSKKTAVHNADKNVFYKKQTNALAQAEQNIFSRTLTDTKRMIVIDVLYCIWIASILYQLNATNKTSVFFRIECTVYYKSLIFD